jgi:hypothetical protein
MGDGDNDSLLGCSGMGDGDNDSLLGCSGMGDIGDICNDGILA